MPPDLEKSPLRIVHLEDSELDCELIHSELRQHLNCHIVTVSSVTAFVAELERAAPDVILSDSNLPRFDGLSALKLAQQKWPATPFIFCSGVVPERAKAEALALGAKAYLCKDDPASLVGLINRLCRGSREPEHGASE